MRPEDFILAYESALATQDWSKVAPLIHDDACVTFSNGAGRGTSVLVNENAGWQLLVEHLGPASA